MSAACWFRKLLAEGHKVAVLDLYLYGEELFDAYSEHPRLRQVKGDLRDPHVVREALWGCDAVIHLACISNDPSFELDPDLGKSINYDAFRPLVRAGQGGRRRTLHLCLLVVASTASRTRPR